MNPIPRPHPQLSERARAEVEKHCFSTTQEEVGGFLVGSITEDTTDISAALPAQGAKASQVSLTFTHEAWEAALSEVDRKHPGKAIVGWYHSHPGFGLFLSGHDEFIQQNFFPAAGQVALVVDPVEASMAWFYYDGSDILEVSRTTTARAAVAKLETADAVAPAKRSLAPMLALGGLAAVAGLVIGWLLGTHQSEDAVAQLDARVRDLSSRPAQPAPDESASTSVPQPAASPTMLVYRVQPGDTLTRIAISVGGGTGSLGDIIDANPGISPDYITVGQRIKVPVKTG